MTNLSELSNEELGTMLRGLEISLKYVYSRKGKKQHEDLIQKCIDEKHRRDEIVRKDYNDKIKKLTYKSSPIPNRFTK